MVWKKHTYRVTKATLTLFVLSFLILSLVGGYIGVRGNKVPYTTKPAEAYEDVSFPSEARDHTQLSGWYLPSQTDKVAVIVHGWGGHRARTLELVEYLQRSGINVLTFDLRGGSGRNSYGYHETGDLAGAITWLKQAKLVREENITVIGISMGGTATTVYAAEHTVGSLVLLSPVVDIQAVKLLALRNRHFVLPGLYAWGGSMVERYIFGVTPTNPRDIFASITEPTLIMQAQDDELAPVETIYALQEASVEREQSNVTYVFVGDEGHKFIDKDQSQGFPYAEAIVQFIQAH